MRIARCTLLLALLAAAAHGADVYRTLGPDGTVIYSDRPENADSEYVYVAVPHAGARATPTQRQAPAPSGAAAPGADAPPEAPATPTLPPGPTAAALRAQREKNCEIARERQQRYEASRRLYRTNPDGEREYLDDRQIAEARAKAAADVKDWCG